MSENGELENRIKELGREIFELLGSEQPSAFNRSYVSGRMMEWSMSRPEVKLNLFRLVDVLPALKTSEAIAAHVREYLKEPAAQTHPALSWGMSAATGPISGRIASLAVKKSVAQMAKTFIAGESPTAALSSLKSSRGKGLAFTVDLLGEYSVSEVEAKEYLNRYLDALEVIGKAARAWKHNTAIIEGHPGERCPVNVSVKLTALYSQCYPLNFDRSVEVLSGRLKQIARKAMEVNASLYVDAEDIEHHEIVIETFKQVFSDKEFLDFTYPGIVVQAYSRSSEDTIYDLIEFAETRGKPIAVRLVKGAYWDYETVVADQRQWSNPLYTEKESTDANYEHLSRILIDNHQHCLPAFGSHNIRSLCHAIGYAEEVGLTPKDFELQVLYGMAEPIALTFAKKGYLVRQYVPLGELLPGMGYLVRRLLENTSNESFLKHTFYDAENAEHLLDKPEYRD